MKLVITLVGTDRLGIVESVSKTVTEFGGSWGDSRVMRVEGQFGGVFSAELHAEQASAFERALRSLFEPEFTLGVRRSTDVSDKSSSTDILKIRVLGADRVGLLHDFAALCTERDINILELDTHRRRAPMSGFMMFEISAIAEATGELNVSEFADCLEAMGEDLVVDVALSNRGP